MQVHINDLNPLTLARDILLLLIAAEHPPPSGGGPYGGRRPLDDALLYAAVSGHLVLYAAQRRAVDALLRGLVDRSSSIASFEAAFPWLCVRGDGRAGGGNE